MKNWLIAFRLRTLPLALSSVVLGSSLALYRGEFSLYVTIACLITTICLQILSNLANDYGDFVNGVDNLDRIGPDRSLQSGNITKSAMKRAMFIFSILSFLAGICLLAFAYPKIGVRSTSILFVIGILAIGAALAYTIGNKPYGYRGLGDLAVFLFFGIIGVAGSYFLHTGTIQPIDLLPAISIGFLATAVLNLNNMRDEENDRANGKMTLAVKLGFQKAKIYQASLIIGAMFCAILFVHFRINSDYRWLFIAVFPLFIFSLIRVLKESNRQALDGELKKVAISTFLFALLFAFSINL